MRIVFYILMFVSSGILFGQNSANFEKANQLYNEGNYTEAIEFYQRILDTEVHSSELYFNLGNAHYKLNHIAPSIYYYEKALLLDPNDKDIQNNLAFARNMTIDAIEVIPEVGFTRLINNATNTLSYDNWAMIAVALVVVFVVLFLSYYFTRSSNKKRLAFIVSGFCIIMAMISVAFAFHKYELTINDQPAIVFVQEAQIKAEPNLRSIETFKLHEGTKVQVLDTLNNWKKIELSDGKTGWIMKEDLKMLKNF